ncbi:MAG: hypothetical protein EPO27_10740 [Betaproteobacteria bacterium]|nr:MAG: hypothetical protein EPO27_10740 [Betaproteobacteria bacterium]
MPVEFAVEGTGNPLELLELQDEWYEDVVLPDIGHLLMQGVEWAGALPGGGVGRLSLSGRGLYVLTRHTDLSGFVSTVRLILGEEHVVLCLAELLPDVRAAIALTEGPEPDVVHSDKGIPVGWVGLRGVRPRKPITPSPAGDMLDALRPLPDVEIALNGGIRIDRQSWLRGFPPAIHVLGDTSTIGALTIDGQEAQLSLNGAYVVPGWDSAGEHTIWCVSTSRTYAIRSGAEEWADWDAYAWSLGEPSARDTHSRPAICGVLVRAPKAVQSDTRPTIVAVSNPVLIGAKPGEIEVCVPRKDVPSGSCVAFPTFEPVWAIPASLRRRDKRGARVILIGPQRPVETETHPANKRPKGRRMSRRRALGLGTYAWCRSILAAGRKGLQPDPRHRDIENLWKTYKRFAKVLWGNRR